MHAHLLEKRFLFFGIELRNLLLELCANGHGFRALVLCNGVQRFHIVVRLAAEIVFADIRNVNDRF